MTGPNPVSPLERKTSLENAAAHEITKTEAALFSVSLRAMRESSPVIDKFVGWSLTGTGATFALLITNLDKILVLIAPGNVRAALALLAISFLCGAASKFRGTFVVINAATDAHVEDIESIKQEHFRRTEPLIQAAKSLDLPLQAGINPIRVLQKLFGVFPIMVRWRLNGLVDKMQLDPLYQYRLLASNMVAQSLWAAAQIAAIVWSMLWIAMSL